ncbi:MAG: hypothetical protein WDO69_27145 [Pseudomonadota bacterium]
MSPKHTTEAILTDSVRCTADSPQTFTCEVQHDSDRETLTGRAPEPPPASKAPPPSPAPPSDPAVSSLVSSFVSRTVVPAPSAPLLSGAALLECASTEASIVLAALGAAKNPLLGALTMLKASYDTGRCLTLAHNDAVQRNAEAYCAAQGGVVVGVEGEKTICEVRETAK